MSCKFNLNELSIEKWHASTLDFHVQLYQNNAKS